MSAPAVPRDPDRPARDVPAGSPPLSWLAWLRYGPFLAQLIVTRRCNLACGYCTEYDTTSAPIPLETLRARLRKLRALRTWAVALMGGEPTVHPDLLPIVRTMTALGFHRRMMTTNGLLLTDRLVGGLNEAGLTDVNVSVDGVKRSRTTVKVLDTLRPRLEILARRARFRVVLTAVVGSAPREEVLQVVEFAESRRFTPRVLLLHDESGQVRLSGEERQLYAELTRRLGRGGREAGGYRERLIRQGEAPFRCRSGARYLYVDEAGVVRWCAQTRSLPGKALMEYTVDDLRAGFSTRKPCNARCSVGCVRTVSSLDAWRAQ